MAEGKGPHVAFFPSPGMGHLIPLTEFAKLLVHRHGFTVTFILFSDFSSHTQTAFLNSLPAGFSFLELPPIPIDDLPADAQMETRLAAMVQRSIPHVGDRLRRLKQTTRLAAYVTDLFSLFTDSVAKEVGVPHYFFATTSLMMLYLILYIPELDRTISCEYRDLPDPIMFPGGVPVRGEDLPSPLQDRTNIAYKYVLSNSLCTMKLDGILANSFVDMEPATYAVLMEAESSQGRPPVYPIGPVIHRGRGVDEKGTGCIRWLDDQPDGSVLFVSFGSGGTLSRDQLRELALGLEASGHRFLWVVRCPTDRDTSGSYFSLEKAEDPLVYLPDGFLERTQEKGLVVPMWAPQMEILSHAATGGFLSHVGWNSALESIVLGVPMIAWPLYAEQSLNAVMLADSVGAAMRAPKARAGEVVKREEVAELVKELMEREAGKKIRGKVRDLKQVGAMAVESEDGSSCKVLAEVALKWKSAVSVTQETQDVLL